MGGLDCHESGVITVRSTKAERAKRKPMIKLTLNGFISWLKKQEPAQAYKYMPPCGCAIGQYCVSLGTTYSDVCSGEPGKVHRHFNLLCDWNAEITQPEPHTFAAALKRAQSCKRKQTKKAALKARAAIARTTTGAES